MVREHEHVAVVRGLLAPPALPAVGGPAPAHGPEHIATEDRRADVLDAPRGKVIIGPCLAAGSAEHVMARARSLFEPGSGPFADAYYAALESAPEAVMAHARLRAAL